MQAETETLSPEDMIMLRESHIKHEASVKSIGALYYISSGVIALTLIPAITSSEATAAKTGSIIILCGLAYLFYKVGSWLRNLDSKARVPSTLFACVGLLGIPLGTLINAYILYLLHSEKGKVVFSEEYHDIIENTPEIKYKTSKLVIGLVIFTIAIVLFALIAPVFLT